MSIEIMSANVCRHYFFVLNEEDKRTSSVPTKNFITVKNIPFNFISGKTKEIIAPKIAQRISLKRLIFLPVNKNVV